MSKSKIKDPYKYKWTKNDRIGCASLIFALLMTGCIYNALWCNGSKIEASGKFDSSLHVDGATWVAEDAVKTLLKAPSTASFLNERVRYFGDSTYSIDGDVDAQNSFGAMIRTGWRVDLKYNKNKDFDIISKQLRE